MDSFSAFAKGEANRDKEPMVFDWVKCAKLIRELKPEVAEAGLHGDWEYTGGLIYSDGKPVPQEDTYVYLSSTWAVPEVKIDGSIFDCFKMQSELPDYDSDTYWPPEALKELEG